MAMGIISGLSWVLVYAGTLMIGSYIYFHTHTHAQRFVVTVDSRALTGFRVAGSEFRC